MVGRWEGPRPAPPHPALRVYARCMHAPEAGRGLGRRRHPVHMQGSTAASGGRVPWGARSMGGSRAAGSRVAGSWVAGQQGGAVLEGKEGSEACATVSLRGGGADWGMCECRACTQRAEAGRRHEGITLTAAPTPLPCHAPRVGWELLTLIPAWWAGGKGLVTPRPTRHCVSLRGAFMQLRQRGAWVGGGTRCLSRAARRHQGGG